MAKVRISDLSSDDFDSSEESIFSDASETDDEYSRCEVICEGSYNPNHIYSPYQQSVTWSVMC